MELRWPSEIELAGYATAAVLVERFAYLVAYGEGDGLRYRIDVTFGV